MKKAKGNGLFDWQELRDTGVGYPCTEGPNVSQSLSPEVYSRVVKDEADSADDEQAAFERGQAEWHAKLDRMIFLFHEADEDRCARKNPYEDEHHRAYREFEEKYGMFGEKLRKPEEENGVGHRLYTLHDVDEYREIAEKYIDEAREIDKYRVECKDEAFQMFSKWFYALWD